MTNLTLGYAWAKPANDKNNNTKFEGRDHAIGCKCFPRAFYTPCAKNVAADKIDAYMSMVSMYGGVPTSENQNV